jgi:hypothetical protein
MNMKSLSPVGRGDHALSLQQEIEQLFDGFARNLAGHVAETLASGIDMSETGKETVITVGLPSQAGKIEIKRSP